MNVIKDFRKYEEGFGLIEYCRMRVDNMCGEEERSWWGGGVTGVADLVT